MATLCGALCQYAFGRSLNGRGSLSQRDRINGRRVTLSSETGSHTYTHTHSRVHAVYENNDYYFIRRFSTEFRCILVFLIFHNFMKI